MPKLEVDLSFIERCACSVPFVDYVFAQMTPSDRLVVYVVAREGVAIDTGVKSAVRREVFAQIHDIRLDQVEIHLVSRTALNSAIRDALKLNFELRRKHERAKAIVPGLEEALRTLDTCVDTHEVSDFLYVQNAEAI